MISPLNALLLGEELNPSLFMVNVREPFIGQGQLEASLNWLNKTTDCPGLFLNHSHTHTAA